MKVIGFIAVFFLTMVGAITLAGQIGLLRGRTPIDIGVRDGRLKPPSFTPNSVSSQADLYPQHPQIAYARIAPLKFTGDADAAMERLANILKHMDRTTVITQEADYLYAQCVTKVFKFTDDVEFFLDRTTGVIHIRSSSRLGRKDMNVNRKRAETIRAQFVHN